MTDPATHAERLAPSVVRFTVVADDQPVTHAQAFDALSRRANWADLFSTMIADSGFDAVFWELPALTTGSADRPFECVLVESDALARMRPNPTPFRQYFANAKDSVVTFAHLGGDAVLVAPTPHNDAAYTHLASFCRAAPRERQRAFWQALAAAVIERLSSRPVWVSTSGLGVAWLHARLDDRPKYYTHAPYARGA